MATSTLQIFVHGLESKNEDVRLKTTRELYQFITTKLREMSMEDVTTFLDEFNHHIFEMVSSSDVNDKKGGILAIVNLLGINVGNTGTRTSRFVNYLRNLLPSSDVGVMELAAYAIGRLALASGTYTAEYVEFEAKRAFEWLSGDRHEAKRHAATAMDTLFSVVIQLGKKYQIYIPMVHKVLTKHRINHQRYDVLISRFIKGTAVEENVRKASSEIGNPRRKLQINIANLQRAWASARRVSKDDWLEWLIRMSVVLLKESPSPALRSCCALAESYDQLPRDMFNAIFLSCWSELHEKQQNELADSLQQALTTQNIPEITQTLLNLAEFMEHCEKGAAIGMCPKAKICRGYIDLEIQLREFDRCHILYQKFLEFEPENCTIWMKFIGFF